MLNLFLRHPILWLQIKSGYNSRAVIAYVCDQNKMILKKLLIRSDFFLKNGDCVGKVEIFLENEDFFLENGDFLLIFLFNLGFFSHPQVVFKSPYDFIRFHRFLKLDILFIYLFHQSNF